MLFRFLRLAGGDIRLADYAGHPLLIVNTASLCGYTPQYAGLQELWSEFQDRGLMIIGVPSNDSADRSPAAPTEIARNGAKQYGVDVSDGRKSRGEGAECASILQMGRAGTSQGVPTLELSQISDRP